MNKIDNYSASTNILGLKNGEEKALAFFIKKYYAALTYFSFSITRDDSFAEEASSDAFIKLWERRENFNAEYALKSFLYQVVKNASINYLKFRKRTLTKGKESVYLGEFTDPNKLALLIQAETYRQVLATLETLPKNCKKIIKLFYMEGKPYTEIAEQLNITVNNTRVQKMRGLRLLKNLVSK